MATNGNRRMYFVNGAWVANITITKAPSEKRKSTKPLVILETVKMYLGTYVFFRRALLPVIEKIAW